MILSELKSNTFAIVGNSPKEIGTKNGKRIDSCDIVFRFNNFNTGPKFADDYGMKTDVWVCSFCRDIKPRNEGFQEILCPLPLDNEHYLRRYGNTNTQMFRDSMAPCIPVDYFKELTSSVPNPSTGLSFLFWVFKEIGKIDPGNIYGFSFFDKSVGHHYFDEDSRCFHEGDLEKKFVQETIFS